MAERPKIIPVTEHRDYVLLWELADEIAKQEGRAADACWLAIMDAFWVGKFHSLYLFSPRRGGRHGRELVKLPSRSSLAILLLGPGRSLPAALRGWTIADYRNQPAPFGGYFTRNPRFGLAILRSDLDRWGARDPRFGLAILRAAVDRSGTAPTFDDNSLTATVTKRLDAGDQPGSTVRWTEFCDAVRDECDGWKDRKKGLPKRGYSNKTIERIVKRRLRQIGQSHLS
jgi:hypothetical protein